MRKVLLLLTAAVMLSGCAQTLTAMVDERAQQQCEENNRTAPGHLDCP